MQKQIKITQSSMPSLDEYIGEIKIYGKVNGLPIWELSIKN